MPYYAPPYYIISSIQLKNEVVYQTGFTDYDVSINCTFGKPDNEM